MINTPDLAVLNDLRDTCHDISKEKGWYDEPRNLGELLCLVHSEVSEALEWYRDHGPTSVSENPDFAPGVKPEGMASELADVLIRTLDLCGYLGIDITKAVTLKIAHNRTRPHRHGGKHA